MIRRLVYIGTEARGATDAVVDPGATIRDDADTSVTGVAFQDNETLVQVLEGPSTAIDRLIDTILAQRGRAAIDIVEDREVPARAFGDTAMHRIVRRG